MGAAETFIGAVQKLTRPGLTWLFSVALVCGVFSGLSLERLKLLWIPAMITQVFWFGSRVMPLVIEFIRVWKGKLAALPSAPTE